MDAPEQSAGLSPAQAAEAWTSFLSAAAIEANPAMLAAMQKHLDLVLEANTHFNLTGIRDPDKARLLHVADSLAGLPLLVEALKRGPGDSILDLGSGAGFPGVPAAIALPGMKFTLCDSIGKKARFLESVARDLALANVKVWGDRAEKLPPRSFDVILCRAVGAVDRIAAAVTPLLRTRGTVLLWQGPRGQADCDWLESHRFSAKLHPMASPLPAGHCIIEARRK